MERSTILSKVFNILIPILDQIYIFQLEDYDVGRYLKGLPRFYLRRNLQKHDTLRYTKYILILLFLVVCILILFYFLVFSLTKQDLIASSVLIFLFIQLLSPFLIIIPSLILKPFYLTRAYSLKRKAKLKISELQKKGMKVIGITGSFGKTTTKNIIYQLTKDSYRVQFTPGNLNTAIGIANWTSSNLNNNTQLLILEMGAYKKGEIKECVWIGDPDITLITTIGEQHMERFKSLENIVKAKLEIFDYSKKGAIHICPRNIKKLLPRRDYDIEFVDTQDTITDAPMSIKMNYPLSRKVAEILAVHPKIIENISKNLDIPERRGNIKKYMDFTFIDSSYNISAQTARIGLIDARTLANKEGKKLIVITGGIPEAGKGSKKINEMYSKNLSQNSDYTYVLSTKYKDYLIKYLSRDKYKITSSINDSLNDIENNFSPEMYIILCQPELTDLDY